MRYAEIRRLFRIPETHPFVSVILIDPSDYNHLTRMIDSRPELELLGSINRQADDWIIYVGCASERVQKSFDDFVHNVL